MKTKLEETRDKFIQENYTGISIGGYEFTERDRLFVRSGWDARESLGEQELQKHKELLRVQCNRTQDLNELLTIALEALNKIGPSTEENSNFSRTEEENQFYIDTANKALAKILELRGANENKIR